ncbi:MAG: kynureninase [Rhizobiaceae bacterium]
MKKDQFFLPDGLIYLDGNSLGPLPRKAEQRVAEMMRNEWGNLLIKGWNKAQWMQQPEVLGDRVGKLIGAPAGTTVIGDTLSIKVYQALASALRLCPDRKIVLSDAGNFPSDLYMAKGLIDQLNAGHELKVVEPEAVEDSLSQDVGVLMLTQVDYRTGRMHDMNGLTRKAQDMGILVIWDLAHSAGALPVDVTGCNAEIAVGCTYKYLNAGPGAPAFIYVRPDLIASIEPALAGWLGHDSPFAFERDYRPAEGIGRMRVGTPSVIQMAALETALDIWDDVAIDEVRQKSMQLCDLFIEQVERKCPQVGLASPRDASQRGSQVSLTFHEGYAVVQALIARGVIGDFREPDMMRFGFAPLFIEESDVIGAVDILQDIMFNRLWDRDEYKVRAPVT